MGQPPRTFYPWHIEASDLVEQGDPEYLRDLASERQLGLVVYCGCSERVASLLALRCERKGSTLIPLTACLPDYPIVIPDSRPAMNMALLSNPRREPEDDGQD